MSISKGFGQNYNDHFDYKKSDFTAVIVESKAVDSLTRFEKVVLNGIDSKIPFNEPTDFESMQLHGVEALIMTGVGHFLMMEDPERFNELLETTIKKLPLMRKVVSNK